MVESEGAFRLTFVQGRGLLSLAGRDFEGLGRVDALELEIPNLRFPFDLSGGVARFKNRRLRLRQADLRVGGKELSAILAKAPLSDFGIFSPLITVEGARLTLCARVALGGHEAEVTAVAALSPLPPRSVRLCVYDVRVYGFLPIPAPLVVLAVFSALGAESPASQDSAAAPALPPLVRVRSAADIHIDACDLAMLAILPMHGWRMPERSQVRVRLGGGAEQSTHVPLLFSQEDTPADAQSGETMDADALAMREFATRCPAIEGALARGDIATALGLLRTLSPMEADDQIGTSRLLQLLVAGEGTLDEAGDLAWAAHARWPDFLPAKLALAAIASGRGQEDEAGTWFDRVAQLSAAQGRTTDESCALLAAARAYQAAGQGALALDFLERALLRRSSLRPVARARIMTLAVEGHWADLVATLGEECVVAAPDVRDEVAQVMELVRQSGQAKDTALVAQAAEALEALLAREHWTETSLSRAEASYQMGLVRLNLGDDRAASNWIASAIEGDASGPVAAAAWRAQVDILRRCAGPPAVVQALAGWAEDGRVPESAGEKVQHLLEAAQIAERDLHDIERTLSLLASALHLSHADDHVLAILERIGASPDHTQGVAEALLRHLRETRPDQGKAVLRVLIRLLVEHHDRHAEAREACLVLLGLAPDDETATYGLARVAWDADERDEAGQGYGKLTTATTLDPSKLAECHLRTAQVFWAKGRREEASKYLEQGLAREPHGARIEVLCEALSELGQESRLAQLLGARGVVPPGTGPHQQVQRSLAAAAERRGDLAQAESIYRELLEASPDDVELLDRLASICKRESRSEDLARWLERLWAIVEREGLSGTGNLDGLAVGLDFASLLARDSEGKARAEVIVQRLRQLAPADPAVLDLLHQLLLERGAFDEAAQVFGERLAVTPAEDFSTWLLARAGLCLAKPGGLRHALTMLQSQVLESLDEGPLTLRADVAERAGEVVDAVLCLQELRTRACAEDRASFTERLTDIASRPTTPREVALKVLENLQAEVPDDLSVAIVLFELYGRMEDAGLRTHAWQDLLTKVPTLPDSYRARLQVALSEIAERQGDFRTAERMLDEAVKLDRSPESRAEQLVVHARLLVARGEVAQAQEDLEEALQINPSSAGALALVAELAYRAQEWERAREAYARLAEVPGAPAVVAPHILAFRRGELAEMFGEHAEAEAAYRDVVALDPRNDSAREALAGFALLRGDLGGAAMHLQEVVRLLPRDSVERLTLARQRLGQVYLGLGDLQAARQHLELALASDPERPSTMELLIATRERLGEHRAAATLCERLSRARSDPAQKAEALFRKGEIMRSTLADLDGAMDAYLRASDLDPSFVPNLARLASYYWALGDFGSLADLGGDLLRAAVDSKSDQQDTGLLVAVAALLFRNDEAMAKAALESPNLGAPLRPEVTVKRLGELAQRVVGGGLDSLEVVLRFLRATLPAMFEVEVREAALAAVLDDPGAAGQALLLARLLDRGGQTARARAAYSLVQFIDPGLGAESCLAELGPPEVARAEVFAFGQVVHPLCLGPLRKALHYLAPALAGSTATDGPPSPPSPETIALFEKLRSELHMPAYFRVIAHGDGLDVTLSATRPFYVLVGRRAESLPAAELRFFLARALEQARAGTLVALRMSQDDLRGLLRAVLRVSGAPGTPFELAEEKSDEATVPWLGRLRKPEVSARIPWDRIRDELVELVTHTLAKPPELQAYIRGCRYTADRIGLLACGQPLAALRGLTSANHQDSSGAEAKVARRQEQLRTSQTLHELVRFMLSEEYGTLLSQSARHHG